ncbi:hypothetical protein L873DRAFT_1389491 [Choiromyces venosus 120613-1]|uniref:Uncharacterized protein n=1 Tax=Choiromyces venosus 120613-1 TaxID=1336337 RepID=A0A3N4J9C2_9PEZI|nr:hypothetical protein L873DRAFT_1389491 [Choiromyces venosus 120613-1]
MAENWHYLFFTISFLCFILSGSLLDCAQGHWTGSGMHSFGRFTERVFLLLLASPVACHGGGRGGLFFLLASSGGF